MTIHTHRSGVFGPLRRERVCTAGPARKSTPALRLPHPATFRQDKGTCNRYPIRLSYRDREEMHALAAPGPVSVAGPARPGHPQADLAGPSSLATPGRPCANPLIRGLSERMDCSSYPPTGTPGGGNHSVPSSGPERSHRAVLDRTAGIGIARGVRTGLGGRTPGQSLPWRRSLRTSPSPDSSSGSSLRGFGRA